MSRFDRTDAAQTGRKIEQTLKQPRIGRVVEVFEHAQEEDNSNFEVDVKILGSTHQHRAIPYLPPSNGEIRVPTVNDKVMVEYRAGEKKQPVARQAINTNEDRAVVGRAGMWRKEIESDSSPAGDGNLYVESYTEYADDPAVTNPDESTAERAFVRLAKKVNADDDGGSVNIEIVDDPEGDAAHVTMELDKKDGADSSATWGIKFDLKTGEFTLLDAEGYGIESDGAGGFTWHHSEIDFSEGTTTSL